MKFQVYRAKKKEAPETVNLSNYKFDGEYEAPTKGQLSYNIGKEYKQDGIGKPLDFADLVLDENGVWWVLTEHYLWATVKVVDDVPKFDF